MIKKLKKLLDLKVLESTCWDDQQYLSPVFLRPKKNNEYRMILNLKKFNQHTLYQYFKMDTFETVLTLIRKDTFMCTSVMLTIQFQWQKNTGSFLGFSDEAKYFSTLAAQMIVVKDLGHLQNC